MGLSVVGNVRGYRGLGVVCEGFTIGNNVLIAVDSFVDFDVPSNSIVFAKPAEIYHKLNSYIYYVKGEAV